VALVFAMNVRFALRFAFLPVLSIASMHCSTAPQSTYRAAAQDPGRLGPKVPPAPDCLANACTRDTDCANGFRCNTALAEPTCETIRCGEVATICSSDDLCKGGMRCHEEQCNPCTFCGDRCSVDFANDTDHCGTCGTKVPATFVCAAGKVVCTEGKTDCAGRCVDLQVDAQNCGACGEVAEPSQACRDGALVSLCKAGERACPGAACAPVFSDTNCGNICGKARVCPSGFSCWAQNYGKTKETFACQETDSTNDVTKTCNAVCAAKGLRCAEGPWTDAPDAKYAEGNYVLYRKSASTLEAYPISCASTPQPTASTGPFDSLDCRCSPP